jgi:DNA-3-methyladenine glycosylase I
MDKTRCVWPAQDPLMVAYHDTEWGVPLHDEHKHFEFLILDAAQAGLSWRTVLYKREGYREAFERFDPNKVARYSAKDVQRLMANPGIIRNRLKIESAIQNAKAFLAVQREFGSFDAYIWRFVKGKTIRNFLKSHHEIQASSPESDAMSQDLKKRGFRFVGSTICYAYMQAAGMVNDHITGCFRYKQCR